MASLFLAPALLLTPPPAGGRGPGGGPDETLPRRIMSLSLCTDALLLALAPPSRIASVTRLARVAAGPVTVRAAMRVRANRQSAEEVARTRPDLVLAGAFTPPATRAMLARVGARVVDVPPATDLAGIRLATRTVAAAVGSRARGEAMIGAMDRTAARLAAAPGPRPRVAAWDGTGLLPPAGSLYHALLTLAGARNVGAEPRWSRGRFDAEALLAAKPDLLVYERRQEATRGRRADALLHPAVRARYARRWVAIDQDAYVCGTPMSVVAAARLRGDLARAISSPDR